MRPIHESIEDFKAQLKTMSYYNAAEGDYRREYNDRRKAQNRLRELGGELMKGSMSVSQIEEFVKQERALVERSDWMPK